jgi:hypothetical protein
MAVLEHADRRKDLIQGHSRGKHLFQPPITEKVAFRVLCLGDAIGHQK